MSGSLPVRTAVPILNAEQCAIVRALAAAGRPGSQISSTDLALATGLGRSVVWRELVHLRATLALGQWDDIAETARERGLLDEAVPLAPPSFARPIVDLTEGETALLRAISAAPGAASTGWAAELGVSPSRVRQLLGALRRKCGSPTTEALVALVRGGLEVRDG